MLCVYLFKYNIFSLNKISKNINISAALAVIPPRLINGCVLESINCLEKQTYPLNKIYLIIPRNGFYSRWPNFNFEKWHNENKKLLSSRVQFIECSLDSPICKYLGIVENVCVSLENDYIFIGDDDQQYNLSLIENMVNGLRLVNPKMYVYQNRYEIVKHGTSGIIHGFVGLMMSPTILKPLLKYDIELPLYIDDQFMSIYFHKKNIKIISSGVHEFSDIYNICGIEGGEMVAKGGDLCLDPMTNNRQEMILNLELKYNVYFQDKFQNYSLGNILNFNWLSPKKSYKCELNLINIENFDDKNIDDEKLMKLNKLFPLDNWEYIIHDIKYIYENYCIKYNIKNIKHLNKKTKQFYSDLVGMDIVNKNNGVYVSLNCNLEKINTWKMLLDTPCQYYDDEENLMLYKSPNNYINDS